MKFTFSVVVLAVVLTVSVAEQLETFKKACEEFLEAKKECYADLDSATVERLEAGIATDKDKNELDQHDFCMNLKLGLQKTNGDIDGDKLGNLNKIFDELDANETHGEETENFYEKCQADPATKFTSESFVRILVGTATDEDKIAHHQYRLCVKGKKGVRKANKGNYVINYIKKEELKTTQDEAVAICRTRPAASSRNRIVLIYFKCKMFYTLLRYTSVYN